MSLLFIWLYCCGAGVSIAFISALPLTSADSGIIISSQSVNQLILLLVFHLVFSCVTAVSMYIHLSLTDTIQSLIKVNVDAENAMPTRPMPHMESIDEDKMTVVMSSDGESIRPMSVVSWNMKQCASCSTQQANTVLVPCGHSVICTDCAKVLLTIPGFRCPLCCVEVFDCHADPITPRVV